MLDNVATAPPVRQRLLVTGVVQGVGFRPFVYGLATANGLTGFVGNSGEGVFIEVEGVETAVSTFRQQLAQQPPPLAQITNISTATMPPTHSPRFVIVPSQHSDSTRTLVPPDVAPCPACQQELLDPHNRRYRYPFINCTHCGPRFTIIKALPYDRPLTTMADFPMCPACQAEYDDPLDRRFHAQPNACPTCGPRIWLEPVAPQPDLPADPVAAVQTLLQQGQVVAIKGVGGFHLACVADDEVAVARLRQRKGRPDKPLAVMAADVATVRQFAHLSAAEEAVLTARQRPILLLRKKAGGPVAANIAPGNSHIGVMLPYTPLHLLLFAPAPGAAPPCPVLVMTSGNRGGEPIVTENETARTALAGLADAFLLHNRGINGRCDDSVLRLTKQAGILPLRRSRGYAPLPITLPVAVPPTLAVGGELKATFCLASGREAYLSQHIGDLENLETLAALETAVSQFQTLFRIAPEQIVSDQHPLYLSKRWAEQQGLPVVAVPHHHAHIAAIMAEHGLPGSEPVIGFSFDGTGYGRDGAVWGGELLLADYAGFERLAHLRYVPLAGGDAAVKRPFRLALAWLWAAGLPWDERLPAVQACSPVEQQVLRRQLETGLNTVACSSMGRLFDAVAALAGVRQRVSYEGQAAIELEALASDSSDSYLFDLAQPGLFDAAPVVAAVAADVVAGMPVAQIAAKFHNGVADLIVRLSLRCREQTGLRRVALSGGVFQNVRLLETAVSALRRHQFEPLTHRLVPPNDGGLALGQVLLASQAARR